MRPSAPRLFFLWATPFLFLGHALAQSAQGSGPTVAFSRQGAEVCAAYAPDALRPLYRERVYAFESAVRLPLQGLPVGTLKEVAGERVALLESSFKACARARTPLAPVSWIDQSCAPAEGICLPPRGFEIDAGGRVRSLPPQAAAALFSKGFAPPALGPPDTGWSFKLDTKR